MKLLIISFLITSLVNNFSSLGIEDKELEKIAIEEISSKDSTSNITIDPEFQDFLYQIDSLVLPYETDCFNDYPQVNKVSQELTMKFNDNELETPYKKIPTAENYKIVLFLSEADVILPII